MERLEVDALVARARERGLGPDAFELHLDVEDRIGEWFVLEPTIYLVESDSHVASRPLRRENGLELEVTGGTAEVNEDPYRGYTLIRPTSDEPVQARAKLDRGPAGAPLITAVRPVGYRIGNLPVGEQSFLAAGGGACQGSVLAAHATIGLEVRAAIQSNVMPFSPTERELHWRYGLYFAYDPAVGFMRLFYNPDFRSQLSLTSTGTNGFFPARAENQLYFILDFVDLGMKTFNKKPMRQRVDISWPPFEDAVLAIEEPVEFFDLDEPSQLVMRLERQEMRLYDYQSLTVNILGHELTDEGDLRLTWSIVNQADVPVRTRWFLLGDFRPGRLPHEGNRLLGPAGEGTARYDGASEVNVPRFSLPQKVSIACVTLTDPILAGMATLNFSHPAT